LEESSAWLPLKAAPIPEKVGREQLDDLRARGPESIKGAQYALALASYWHDTRREVVVDEELHGLASSDMSEDLWKFIATDRWGQQELGTKRHYDPARGGVVRATVTGDAESPSVTLELVASTTADAPEYHVEGAGFSRDTYEVEWDGDQWQWLAFATAESPPEVLPSANGGVKGKGWIRLPAA